MLNLHIEILDAKRKETFHILNSFAKNCYLAGGTALALQVGHRRSLDFDLFTRQPIGNSLRKQVRDNFGDVRYFVNSSDQISFTTNTNISITFLYYWFPLLKKYIQTNSLPLASVADIIADKAHTLGRRAVWRDYADIFYMLYHKLTNLTDIVLNAKEKFGGEFVVEQFLEQLVYYQDLEVVQIDWIGKKYEADKIKNFLTATVKTYMQTVKSR